MNFKELEENKLTENDFLWKYLDFHKFLFLFLKKQLYFSRLDLLQDPFEGITTSLLKQRAIAMAIPEKKDFNTGFSEEEINGMLNQKSQFNETYSKESSSKQKIQFVNCWFRENRESMAMWNIYSNNDSVAIKINGNDFIAYIKNLISTEHVLDSNNKFICGSVKYFELNPIDLSKKILGVQFSSFKKDVSFEFEKEYRLLIVTPDSYAETNPGYQAIDLNESFFKMIEIVCHPQIEEWKFQNIIGFCSKCDVTNVRRSLIEVR